MHGIPHPQPPRAARQTAAVSRLDHRRDHRDHAQRGPREGNDASSRPGPASLYVYVTNTAALHAAVLDDLLGSVEPASEGDWQSRLEALLTDFGRVLFAYPGLARSALVLRPTGPNAILLYDRLLGLLLEGRIEPARAAWGVDLLLQYVTANAAEHSAPAPSDVDTAASDAAEWDDLTRALRTASPEMAPHVAAHAEAILGGTPEQRVDWALRALVAGIAATALPDSRS